jgi:hypothetical protein
LVVIALAPRKLYLFGLARHAERWQRFQRAHEALGRPLAVAGGGVGFAIADLDPEILSESIASLGPCRVRPPLSRISALGAQ